MEPVQVLLFTVVTVLTLLLLLVGIQVFFLLRDLQKAIRKFNTLLEDVAVVSGAVARPVAGITELLHALREFLVSINTISRQKQETTFPGRFDVGDQASLQNRTNFSSAIRFFHKNGKPLSS